MPASEPEGVARDVRQPVNKVQAYYDANVEHEWDRLTRNKLEFGVTCRILDRFVPRGASVLDVGGGPGRYSFRLAQAGHAVTLYDLSAANVEFARAHERECGVSLKDCIQGDVLDLGAAGLGPFEVVLCMGPLYHLLEADQRTAAVKACIAALRPGGLLFVTFISSYAPLLEAMRNRPAVIAQDRDGLLRYLSDGRLIMPEGEGFTDAFLFKPDTIAPFMATFPLEPLLLTAVEGLPSQTENSIYAQEPAVLEAALDIVERTGSDPLTWGATDHLLYVGRKA